ncbi:unnamed protein product [Bursaphelenchus okinawaensis]|uniref:LYR motif-containing protein 5 n=1 Tax=Bursaphelenchus okinawaensis TaxID=465554 RepID=A0A811KHS2_9BILA|nr:unnamed protein product [Bursaphelenchus okinawaensis]CAG9103339.1 unnamed protein product [Bursaphelenchus okinawaensis]
MRLLNKKFLQRYFGIYSDVMKSPYYIDVLKLYKTLRFMGRDYPKGADYFNDKLRIAFKKQKEVEDPKQIKELISRGNYVIKELETLYFLKRYRTLKGRYYEEEPPPPKAATGR